MEQQQQAQARAKILQTATIVLVLVLFYVALWALRREIRLSHSSGEEVLRYFKLIPFSQFFQAFFTAMGSYLALTFYDFLGLRHIGKALSYGRTALTSFIAYTFSHNIGAAPITGGGIRLRFYSSWGLSVGETAKVLVICGMTFWVGFLTMGGVFLLLKPPQAAINVHLPLTPSGSSFALPIMPIALLCLLALSAYLLSCVLLKRTIKLWRWSFPTPSIGIALGQMAAGSLDWTCSGMTLYLFLPSGTLGFPAFMAIYLSAQLVGFASQVPGGLGVLETVMLILLSPFLPTPQVAGALLAFRIVYYLIPFILGLLSFALYEIFRNKEGFKRALPILNRWAPDFVPHVSAVLVFMGGAVLLFSNAFPEVSRRMVWLNEFLPLSLLESSHFLSAFAGAGLLILARGLQLRLDGAYLVSLIFLGVGVLTSLFKGFDYQEALVLLILFGTLLPCRRYFPRKASLFRQRYPPAWVAAVLFMLMGSIWVGVFNYRYEDYSGDLWLTFDIVEDAARFLRATLGSTLALVLFSIVSLLSPPQAETEIPDPLELEKVWEVIKGSRLTYAFLALLDDKALLVNKKTDAFIMYGIEGKSWVAVGDPVGPAKERAELAEKFRDYCRKEKSWAVFHQVAQENSQLYLDLGLTVTKFCEEARVPLSSFTLDQSVTKELKSLYQRLKEKEEYSFEILPPEKAEPLFPALKKVSEEWLGRKKTREKGFVAGFFHEQYLRRFPMAVVRQEGQPIAFANLWQGSGKEEIAVDLLRSSAGAPPSVEDYLLLELMLWGKEKGVKWFNLGSAPLVDAQESPLAPFQDKIAGILSPYESDTLLKEGRKTKEKFNPEWRPQYLAMSADLALPVVLANIQTLLSKGTRQVFKKIRA